MHEANYFRLLFETPFNYSTLKPANTIPSSVDHAYLTGRPATEIPSAVPANNAPSSMGSGETSTTITYVYHSPCCAGSATFTTPWPVWPPMMAYTPTTVYSPSMGYTPVLQSQWVSPVSSCCSNCCSN
ncbi:hypothetical protein C8R42DRAFT_662905 [Lentinula raphanica]|nr:hypothetical protein C8R42DRAFT_662905 [Lentinula raphanica]